MERRIAPRLRDLVIALVAVVAIAGCAGPAATPPPPTAAAATPAATEQQTAETAATPSPADATPALPDPCSLLTQDEADGLAGVALQTQMPQGNPPTNCVWPTPLTGSVAQVEVGVGDGAKKFLDIDKDVLGHDFAQVSGLGDEAWVEDDTIFVRVGELWFSLHLVGHSGTSAYRPKLEALAQTIVGRLGR